MILVIADDFSGAAELAGIAASRGLSAEVHTKLAPESTAQVIALDAQTRHLPPEAAARRIREIHQEATTLAPDHIFKKTDSVLRGNILAELTALLNATGRRRTIFIPANPSKGRMIRNGRYLVNSVPLDQSAFASDPEHPQRSADVVTALGKSDTIRVHSIRTDEDLPSNGIIIPDAETPDDITKRASELDDGTLAAGAAEFFSAALKRWITEHDWKPLTIPEPEVIDPTLPRTKGSLFVSGSLAAWDRGTADKAREHGMKVFKLAKCHDRADAISRSLLAGRNTMIAIGPRTTDQSPRELTDSLASTACQVIRHAKPATILIEGGATASAVLSGMEWTRFKATACGLVGVGGLVPVLPKASVWKPRLFIKPGSYPWPSRIWDII